MLLRFRCKNFRSIRDSQELSLVAVNTRSDERNDSLLDTPIKGVKALRCAAIYGGNASGKSNVVQAINVFFRMVSESQRQWEPSGPIPTWDPFALDDVSQIGAAEFEIDFVLGPAVYTYGFRFNSHVILEEWLLDNTHKGRELFRREMEEGTVSLTFRGRNLGATVEESRHLDGIRLQTRPNSLFLSSAAQNNHELLSKIFQWIVAGLGITSSGRGRELLRYPTADGCSTGHRKSQVAALLAFADVGIVDFEISEEDAPEELKKFARALVSALKETHPERPVPAELGSNDGYRRHKIVMKHRGANGRPYPLPFEKESTGTRAYFELLGPLLDRLRDASGVLIDELESSLHPNLSRQLIRIFNAPSFNPKGAQLIFTTHDTNLLDLGLLRRDQVWFTEKSRDGATELVRLSDFKPRKDQNIAASYLHGRFGAIPFLDDDLLRVIREPEFPALADQSETN